MELIVLSQTVCSGCRELEAWLENEKEERGFDYTEINIDEDKEAVAKYRIMSTPVTILMDDGEEVARVIGFNQSKKDDLNTLLDELE